MSQARCPAGNIEVEATGRFRTRYLARIPAGHTVEDVLSPAYFGQLIGAQGFRELDHIEVEWEDGNQWGMLQVRSVEPSIQMVGCREITEISEITSTTDLPDNWSMKFVGHGGKWAIFHGAEQVEAGFPTPERARNRVAMLAVQNAQRNAMQTGEPAKRRGRPPKAATDTQATAEAAQA